MLDFDFIEWDGEDVPQGNTRHIADNGLAEVEDVLFDPASRAVKSRSSKRPGVTGATSTGKTIIVVYERHEDGGDIVTGPCTAYEVSG